MLLCCKIDLFNTYFFIDYYLYFIARQKELQPSNAISLLSPESYTLIGRLVSGQGLSDPSTFQRKAALSSQELLNTLIALKVIDVIKVNELKARLEPARIITPQYLYDGCWPAGVGEYSD
ncbi:hypothetical protein KG892_04505 [Vermiphilus pyriformis]|nr:MAG: hypothetical protein KG892_04505 [Vermiphilus pyriformis]